MNHKGFFTIGGAEIVEADIKIPNVMLKFQSSFQKVRTQTSISTFLTSVKSDLRAIGLLYNEGNPFGDIILSDRANLLPINDKIIGILTEYLIDLVVFAGKTPCDKCELIEKIHNDFSRRKYVLREVQFNDADDEISLNRCAIENSGFLPEMFRLGKPTPGAENDCTGPHYLFEDNIPEATAPVNVNFRYPEDEDIEFDETCVQQAHSDCSSSIPQSDYTQTTTDSIAKSINQQNVSSMSNACTTMMLRPEADDNVSIIQLENRRKRNIGVDTDNDQ